MSRSCLSSADGNDIKHREVLGNSMDVALRQYAAADAATPTAAAPQLQQQQRIKQHTASTHQEKSSTCDAAGVNGHDVHAGKDTRSGSRQRRKKITKQKDSSGRGSLPDLRADITCSKPAAAQSGKDQQHQTQRQQQKVGAHVK
jgi:hypothetical protein